MKVTAEGLTIWSENPDGVQPGSTIAAGMSPANLSNTMRLHYRIDDGLVHVEQGELVRADSAAQTYHFKLPEIDDGQTLQYQLEGACVGRTVYAPWQTIRVTQPIATSPAPVMPNPNSEVPDTGARIPFHLEYLCRFHIYLGRGPEIIGATPEGIKVNWYPTSGECKGPKLNALLRPEGGDWMTIRTDGVGILGVRGTLQTYDGALIYATYSGVFELGENGYENFLNHKWPNNPPTRTTPMFITAHPDYLWINRLQCIGIGIVHMDKLMYEYDMYALR